jgi:hypothetical protein
MSLCDVRFWHLADIPLCTAHVCYWGKSGHGVLRCTCLLLTQSGHRTTGVAAAPPPMCAGLFSYHFVHIYIMRGRYGAAFVRP